MLSKSLIYEDQDESKFLVKTSQKDGWERNSVNAMFEPFNIQSRVPFRQLGVGLQPFTSRKTKNR